MQITESVTVSSGSRLNSFAKKKSSGLKPLPFFLLNYMPKIIQIINSMELECKLLALCDDGNIYGLVSDGVWIWSKKMHWEIMIFPGLCPS